MAISQAMVTSFKRALLDGEMDFSSNTSQSFKIALFTNSASLNAATTAYSTSNEVSGTNYTAGGNTLALTGTNASHPTTSGTTAFLSFRSTTWANATITARGAVIYKSGGGDPAIAVLDFGADKTATAGNFTINFPVSAAGSAIIRIA